MAEMPLDLDGIRQRHRAVVSCYRYLTGAERDRRTLLAEVDRLHAEVSRLQADLATLQEERNAEAAQASWRRSATR